MDAGPSRVIFDVHKRGQGSAFARHLEMAVRKTGSGKGQAGDKGGQGRRIGVFAVRVG